MGDRLTKCYLSGGSANTDPNLSLGGAISTTELVGQTIAYDSTSITGISLTDAAKLATGTLHYVASGNYLGLQISGGAVPTTLESVQLTGDGDYVIENPETGVYIVVSVVFASLPASDTSAAITASNILQNLFKNVSQAEAQAGDIVYRHFYLKNIGAVELLIDMYLIQQFTGMDYIEIGTFYTVSGTEDALLADDHTAPSGVTFYQPLTADSGVSVTVAAGEYIGVFLKRTVTTMTDTSTPNDVGVIGFSILEGL